MSVPVALLEEHKGKVGGLGLQRTQLLIALRGDSGCCGPVRFFCSFCVHSLRVCRLGNLLSIFRMIVKRGGADNERTLSCAGMLEHGRSPLATTGSDADDGADVEAADAQLLATNCWLFQSCQSRLAAAYQQFDVALAAAEVRLPRAVIQSWRWHPPAVDSGSAVQETDVAADMTTIATDVGKSADDSSTTMQSGQSDEHLCVICIAGLQARDGGVRLPCGHLFHETCVAEWLRRNSSCPHCRAQLLG